MMDKDGENYWNFERGEEIICPYCGMRYEPSYDDTYIGGKGVDCYTEDEDEYTCDRCGKKFTLRPYIEWKYETETIDGEATEEEVEGFDDSWFEPFY